MVKRTKSLTYTMMFPVINMESSNIFLRPLSYGDLVTLIIAHPYYCTLVAMEMILEELEYEEILSLCSTSEQFRSLCKESYEKKRNTERKISQFVYYNVFFDKP